MKPLYTLIIVILSATAWAQQGICGKVSWTSGNQMPGPDRKLQSTSAGIAREIFIYEATTTEKTTQSNGFYSAVQTKLVKKIKTKKGGTFSVKLPEGTYSVFVKESGGLWANTFDGQGRINPVTVTANNMTVLHINVNYRAAY
jgi:hypothetical protein